MSKQQRLEEKRATEEIASEAQPTHYNVAPHEQDLESRGLAPSSSAKASSSSQETNTHGANVNAEPPVETIGIEIKEAGGVAGGVPAIVQTVRHAWREMGARRSLKTLLALNQKDGFDCPGCAWPEPDGERSHAEFCENGAKAVAEEATTKRVTPEFFRKWSVSELSEQ